MKHIQPVTWPARTAAIRKRGWIQLAIGLAAFGAAAGAIYLIIQHA